MLADPAILASGPRQKSTSEKKSSPVQKPKAEVGTPPTTTESSVVATPDTKAAVLKTTASAGRTVAQAKPEATPPNATATVERDVSNAFKSFASQQRRTVEVNRAAKASRDKEVKLNDLKKFADSFKLNTPVPSDLVSIIAKDPAKQKQILEKANRNAEEAKTNPTEAVKPVLPPSESRAPPVAQRPNPAAHAPSPSNNQSRQTPNRNQNFSHQQGYGSAQSFRSNQSSQIHPQMPAQQSRGGPGNLGARLKNLEKQNLSQAMHAMPIHDARHPPTGPSNAMDPNFSRRSSGVTSAQGGRLNPHSSEFRPNANAIPFSPHQPNSNPSTGSSPRSAAIANNASVEQPSPAPVARSLLKRKPLSPSARPSLKEKFNALEQILTIKPIPPQDWKHTGGIRPAYDTPPIWRQPGNDEPPESSMSLTYTKLFEMTPFPTPLSPPNPSHAVPQVPHQHQLPFHLQQGVHNMNQRQSPRAPPMNLPNQHGHGPVPQFSGPDEHRMMPSHSAQSFASPRPHNAALPFPSPMGQPAQLFNPQMMPYNGAPPMNYRSLSQNHQFVPQQHMAPPIMMQNPAGGFMTSQGMAPGAGPQIMYPGQPGPQGHFIPQGNGHPPPMPGANGYPSPGRGGAPMMMSQGSQQGHQQPAMYGMNPGMSPGPQYGNAVPVYAHQPPNQSKSP